MNAPIFQQADYLSKISGQGLNPLLQNYWMTIHPPTLFLGFASTVFPFAYAASGLWYREHKSWLKPVLGWSLFSAGILGLGILMGGAWAYEALSFAGYWAWDPVENASIMPWLILTAYIHSIMVQEKRNMLKVWNVSLIVASFSLALLGTFLVRSGILQSIHAFGDSTVGPYFLGLIAVVVLGSTALIVSRLPLLRADRRIESLASREAVFLVNNLLLVA
jgi:cytochrome c-type biogenesis protein CcmF